LGPVADQEHLGPRLRRKPSKPVERQRAGKGSLVDDDELSIAERGSSVVVLVEPPRGVVAGDSEILGEHGRRGRRRSEPDVAGTAVDTRPCPVERARRGRLARSSRADEEVDLPAGDGDRCERRDLMWSSGSASQHSHGAIASGSAYSSWICRTVGRWGSRCRLLQ